VGARAVIAAAGARIRRQRAAGAVAMLGKAARALGILGVVAAALGPACGRQSAPRPLETFHWVSQPIAFEPPPPVWRREGDNSGGMLGVRFVLTGGVGEAIGVASYKLLADHDRREKIAKLLAKRDSLARREFLDELSLIRYRSEQPVSEREAEASRVVNRYLDSALENYLADRTSFVAGDLSAALQAASEYQLTLPEILPSIRLRPETMQEPERWRVGYERDTTIAGQPAFAGDDTLITPYDRLLYREIFWVVNGRAFKATYQGLKKNEPAFDRLVASIQFPESASVAPAP
jgi:hypothetical protein